LASTTWGRTQIEVAKYFYPLLFHVKAAMAELEYLIGLYDEDYDFNSLKRRLAGCKKNAEVWCGRYAYRKEPKKINDDISIKTTCQLTIEFLEYASQLEKGNQFRIQLNSIRRNLLDLYTVSQEELRENDWDAD
jgi:hypothetical protein